MYIRLTRRASGAGASEDGARASRRTNPTQLRSRPLCRRLRASTAKSAGNGASAACRRARASRTSSPRRTDATPATLRPSQVHATATELATRVPLPLLASKSCLLLLLLLLRTASADCRTLRTVLRLLLLHHHLRTPANRNCSNRPCRPGLFRGPKRTRRAFAPSQLPMAGTTTRGPSKASSSVRLVSLIRRAPWSSDVLKCVQVRPRTTRRIT